MRNVTKKIGVKTIIENLSFTVQKGEVFGLLGPNGAGKTMTIRMIVGLISISSGDIFIQGKNITTDFTKAIAQVGAIVENPELYNFLTGYQNLLHFTNLSPGVSNKRIEELVGFLKLGDYIHEKVATYSLGMKQRLGIAQALLHHPSVLILDEPTNGLDPAGIKELRQYLRYLADEEDVAVIVSSHILAEMDLLCDRTAIIKNGKLLDVRSLTEATGQFIQFEVDRPIEAVNIINNKLPGVKVTIEGNYLGVNVNRENAAQINTNLIGQGIIVYGFGPKTKSLEDIFMEVTVDGND